MSSPLAIREPLTLLFSSRQRIDLMRALVQEKRVGGGRALARIAGVPAPTAAMVLREWEERDMIERERSDLNRRAGVKLNENNRIISDVVVPLFQNESKLCGDVDWEIRYAFLKLAYQIAMGDPFFGTKPTVITVPFHRKNEAKRIAEELKAGYEETEFKPDFRVEGPGEVPGFFDENPWERLKRLVKGEDDFRFARARARHQLLILNTDQCSSSDS